MHVTLVRNGSDKIGGLASIDATIATAGIAVTLIFIDSTQGWLVTDDGVQSSASDSNPFMAATGGTVTTVSVLISKYIHLQVPEHFVSIQNSRYMLVDQTHVDSHLVVAGGGGTAGYFYGESGSGGAGGARGV